MRENITAILYTFAIYTMTCVSICTDMTLLGQLGIVLAAGTSIYLEINR